MGLNSIYDTFLLKETSYVATDRAPMFFYLSCYAKSLESKTAPYRSLLRFVGFVFVLYVVES